MLLKGLEISNRSFWIC